VPDAIDYLIAAACFAGFTLPVLLGAASRIGSPAAVAGFGLLAAAPLIVRRKWPIATVVAVGIVYVAATLAGVRFTPFVSNAGPNFAIAVFTAADRCPRRSSLLAAMAAGVATWAVLPLGIYLHHAQDQDAVQAVAAIPAWVAGDIVRSRRIYRQRLALETRRQVAEKEGRIRAEERLRLSRDVHDVVSHSLSMIAVRSGVARLLLDERPEEARVALATIETASRSALDDLRKLLRQIRDPAEDENATPALGDLPALVDRLRRNGLDLSYRCTGQPRAYSTALELSAYRIAQEALTNVVKHAGAARASVEVAHGQSELTITVTDDGPDPARRSADLRAGQSAGPGGGRPTSLGGGQSAGFGGERSAGLGIVGMQERAAMLGGQLMAGPRREGGFTVVARLPVKDSR